MTAPYATTPSRRVQPFSWFGVQGSGFRVHGRRSEVRCGQKRARGFLPRQATSGSHAAEKKQHLRPLAPGLSRRPCSAAYGPGPSVFTIRAKKVGHGSRLGFPGRRLPRDPTASANVARGLQVLLAWRDPLAERKPVSAFLRICFPHRLAGGGGRGPAARRRISQPIIPINGALILRGRTGEASDRTRRAGEPRCSMFEMLQTEEGVF